MNKENLTIIDRQTELCMLLMQREEVLYVRAEERPAGTIALEVRAPAATFHISFSTKTLVDNAVKAFVDLFCALLFKGEYGGVSNAVTLFRGGKINWDGDDYLTVVCKAETGSGREITWQQETH